MHPLPLGPQPAGGWEDRQTDGQAGRINSESGPQDSLPRWEEPQPDHWLLVQLLIESPFVLARSIGQRYQKSFTGARLPPV